MLDTCGFGPWVALVLACLSGLLTGCYRGGDGDDYDPLATALSIGDRVDNREAVIPPQCYTATEGRSNPCWACHTEARFPNMMGDFDLQTSYAFSTVGQTNHWTNLFVDVGPSARAISDEEILRWVRSDNYAPLRRALERRRASFPGYVPDLDLSAGFDEDGFARDGSGWRAFRYKPFVGTFWPTNGSTDDVFVRLPLAFRMNARGQIDPEIYRANLATLEAAMKSVNASTTPTTPISTSTVSGSLRAGSGSAPDSDSGSDSPASTRGDVDLPHHYFGAASMVPVSLGLYPEGTEFLHSVRYLDPDAPDMIGLRMKELRYARKVGFLDRWAIQRAYEREAEEKDEGVLPTFPGSAQVGLRNSFGWQLQAYIEDDAGRLRLQTREEHLFCMGCHSSVGITADQTFAFPRKVPGPTGWGYQSLAGIPDVPQVGHADPEYLTYLRRVGGGDEFRANDEMLTRFFPEGRIAEAEIRRADGRGDNRDIRFIILPSRARALLLSKAYRVRVARQDFVKGRDALLGPAENVLRAVSEPSTDLSSSQRVFRDGRLQLDWGFGP
ncbi:MAG: hypothetical protein H6729_13650 [Deltaproteobacteria bacterium]|nr:hypothetical protein [Deltaproteobacteria bacterium]